jgi:serine/threonine protein kinase
MAPENLLKTGFDLKVDVWSLGAIYYNLITGLHAFNAKTMSELVDIIKRGDWKWPTNVNFSLQGLEFLKSTF